MITKKYLTRIMADRLGDTGCSVREGTVLKIFSDDDGGLFGVCLGSNTSAPTEHDLDAIMTMQDAEDIFERSMEQAVRTTFEDDLHIRLALSALIEAWKCVQRARSAAGY